MPEYRRFVAYFYEYIDGKKQKNAGFAKVELRNGMWRILFRLTIPTTSRLPAQVYGFVREGDDLLGFPLGTMRMDIQQPEEWAWRADAALGLEKYGFGQMNGIRIQSPEGRLFITVWDDEALDPAHFVLAEPEPEPREQQETMQRETPVGKPALKPKPQEASPEMPAEQPQELPSEQPAGEPEPKPRERPEVTPPERPEGEPEPKPREWPEVTPPERPEGEPEPKPRERPEVTPPECPAGIPVPTPSNLPVQPQREIPVQVPPEMPGSGTETAVPGIIAQEKPHPSTESIQAVESLLRSRQHFRPFEDDEFSECVQIRMCDLVSLQQEGWQVGRSNFLWHGYSLYRHLLLGRYQDGGYVLGVPGEFNRQEEYVAGVFDFGQFKLSSLGGCGRRLGYWYRRMLKPEGAETVVSARKLGSVDTAASARKLERADTAASARKLERADTAIPERRPGRPFTATALREKEKKEDMTWN